MEKSKKSGERYLRIFFHIVTVAYGILCFYLYYMQSVQPLDPDNHYFESDLPYHISMIVQDGWGYSLTACIYKILYAVCGNTTVGIAVFLALISVFTVYATDWLFSLFLKREHGTWYTLLTGLLANLIMPFFWKYAGSYRYVSYQSGNIWHNSTYQCMKLVALITVLYYWKVQEHYGERGLSFREWIILSLLLATGTGVKPSFLTVFAPVMAIFLLADLCKKVPFKYVFQFGSTVFPSLAVLLWQKAVLFGTDTGNGIGIRPWYSFSLHADRPKLAVLCSLAFPLLVLLFSLKDLWKDRKYLFFWIMTGIGFLEALLLVEVGERSRAGNFLWGYSFAIFLISLYSIAQFLKLLKQSRENRWYLIPVLLSAGVLSYQIVCGLIFFTRLLQGETYWMLG